MQEEGLDAQSARDKIWLMDSAGLVTTTRDARKDPHKDQYAKNFKDSKNLLEIVTAVKPTCLIGKVERIFQLECCFSNLLFVSDSRCGSGAWRIQRGCTEKDGRIQQTADNICTLESNLESGMHRSDGIRVHRRSMCVCFGLTI